MHVYRQKHQIRILTLPQTCVPPPAPPPPPEQKNKYVVDEIREDLLSKPTLGNKTVNVVLWLDVCVKV